MDLQLTNKVVIVTGGAKGIGKGIVDVLAKEGAIAVIVGRSEADNLLAVKEVEAAGGSIVMPKFQISEQNGYMAIFMDTEGNKLAMHTMN